MILDGHREGGHPEFIDEMLADLKRRVDAGYTW